mgnify:CR=1 FL=1
MFIGRKDELNELKHKYNSNKLEMILLSGKRRVGKSQLIVESSKTFVGKIVSYECFLSSYEANLRLLEAEIKKIFNNTYLYFNSLYDVILFLHTNAEKEKILLVIDEYPYMREGDTTDSEIKNALDKINELDCCNPLKIIVCGSSIDVMETLDKQNKPLYGRFTSKINIYPLNYLESSYFYPKVSMEDKVNYYSVLGGVPYYLKQVDESLSFDENIIRLFFSSSPLLTSELESQINNEISKIEKAPLVLNILKNKTLSYTDILQAFNNSFPDKSIDYVLDRLTKIKAIEKLFIKQDNGKQKPYYRIKEISLVFYFTFLNHSHGNRLLYTDMDFYKTFIEDELKHSYMPLMFEKIGFEFISLMNKNKLLPDKLFDLYPYIINDRITKKNYQFDIVGECKKGLINYECKYQDNPIAKSTIIEESRQAELSNEKFIKTVFISKSIIDDNKVEKYYLSDLFNNLLV